MESSPLPPTWAASLNRREGPPLLCARRQAASPPAHLSTHARGLSMEEKNLRASRQAASPPASPPERQHPQTRQGVRRRGRGGAGDVPGAGYCYAAVREDMMTKIPQRCCWCDGGAARRRRRQDRRRDRCGGAPPPIPGSYGSSWRSALPTQSTPARTTTATRLRHREDGADGSALVHGRDGVRPQRV